eukprot:NODE_178_length_1989_cov_17.357680_g154_i0.p1 GENE.NODE_178_length_1989_cov_17.357680_g154_i0~~NODE_178_length_1989_cov_17.357680_g154_i0.p1  ORF type:complete len:354 (-),score=57.24 NODE_178_length_1989_cov_17.357680_g154_i0:844-1905(-)
MWTWGRSKPKEEEKKRTINLLVIQADDYDWPEIFKDCTLSDGSTITIRQTGWNDILVGPCDNYSKSHRCGVSIRKLRDPKSKGHRSNNLEIFFPDYILVRNEVKMPMQDNSNFLFAFMYANIPAMNSLESINAFRERAIVQGALNKIHDRLGDQFPVGPQNFFPTHQGALYSLPFPAVVKIGTAHAGFGKMKIPDHHDMEDFQSVLAMNPSQYCIAEPFHVGEYDIRVQKIGTHYRAFHRQGLSANWKTNTGSAHLEEVPMTDKYRLWAEEAGQMFGGLDICTVDAIHCADGTEVILEVNPSSSGLGPDCAEEDNIFIRDLVIEKLNALFVPTAEETARQPEVEPAPSAASAS